MRSLGALGVVFAVAIAVSFSSGEAQAQENDGKLRIICFGAHPDDAELKVGGTAAKWAALGHHVKLVSVTNGDIGHWRMSGGELARRRTEEVRKAAKILGVETEVLDIHDGELLPTLENRRLITRKIREWKADVVMSHRPNDYHPDHRYVGVLVQDAAFMVTVPNFCPDTPFLRNNPAFFYYSDGFQKPNPFSADVIVSIDDVMKQRIDALDVLVSQFHEGGANGSEEHVRKVPPESDPQGRRAWTEKQFSPRYAGVADKYRQALIEWHGAEAGKQVKHAEAFEICEYGRKPSRQELRKLFPFFPKAEK